ncbi:MAG: maleylpyruvate isomerase family mycothiol-dependent enzyme [Actinomycetota bacterium]|nr:maleylpyruvate isomerase family mycothiol-dependent enzyme [Actinomycetota bacterium]
MTTATTIDVASIQPITHAEAALLAEAAYDRLVAVFEGLAPHDWARPTDCDGWTVRHLAGHMVGAMRSAASVRELVRQQREVARRVKRDGGTVVDVMAALQIELAAHLSPADVVAELRRLVPLATRGRRRTPWLLRKVVRFPVELGTINERWTLGYLVDVILTRDAWLHRIDLCRAVGSEPTLSPELDGRIVADLVAEWAGRHGAPVRLTLTGPAGGTFTSGAAAAGDELQLDAIEFCRIISGRARGEGLLTTEVPF